MRNKIVQGDYCLLQGDGTDVCVRVIQKIDDWQGATRFVGEKISLATREVVTRRAFFEDQVLKVLKRDELGLSRP